MATGEPRVTGSGSTAGISLGGVIVTGDPAWATVTTGLFGTKTSFVPINLASPKAGNVHVDATKDQVKDAPKIDPDGELSADEERELYTYYGREHVEAKGTRPSASKDTVREDRQVSEEVRKE